MTQDGRASKKDSTSLRLNDLAITDLAIYVHRVNLEDVFRQIEANRRHRV